MSKKPFFDNKNPGSLDFIENSLNENSKDLKMILDQVKSLAEQRGDASEPSVSRRILDNLTSLQVEVEDIMKFLRMQNQQSRIHSEAAETKISPSSPTLVEGSRSPVVIRCKTWEDFKSGAVGSEKVSFIVRESEKVFEADALKGNQIIAFVGELPQFSRLLKLWLSNQLDIAEDAIFEGTLTKV